jgi:hypothetical protein
MVPSFAALVIECVSIQRDDDDGGGLLFVPRLGLPELGPRRPQPLARFTNHDGSSVVAV